MRGNFFYRPSTLNSSFSSSPAPNAFTFDQTRPVAAAVASVARLPMSLSSNFPGFNLGHRKGTLNWAGSSLPIGCEDSSTPHGYLIHGWRKGLLLIPISSLSDHPVGTVSYEVCLHNVLSRIGRGPGKRHLVGIQPRRQLRKG